MTIDVSALTPPQRQLLVWLSESEYSQYGECYGKALDFLQMNRLIKVWPGMEHQEGFISKRDHAMFRAVSLTAEGRALAKALKEKV